MRVSLPVELTAFETDALDDEIAALLDDTDAPITQRRVWLEAWCQSFPDWHPVIIGLRTRAEVVAAVLLATRGRRGYVDIVGLGHGVSDMTHVPMRDPVLLPDLVSVVGGWLEAQRRPWRLRLEQVPVHDHFAHALSRRMALAEARPGDGCPRLDVTERDTSLYLGKKTRRDIRQGQRRLAEDGRTHEVRRASRPEDVLALLPAIAKLHRTRDHAMGRRSDIDDPAREQFFTTVLSRLAARGEVEITAAWVDGALAGFDLALLDPPGYRIYDGRIAPGYERYSPGHLVHELVLDRVVSDDQLTFLDWMRGEEAYKLRMAGRVDDYEELVAWSSRSVKVVTETPVRARTAWREARERWPALERAWQIVKRKTLLRGAGA